jgi:hypothetical protein
MHLDRPHTNTPGVIEVARAKRKRQCEPEPGSLLRLDHHELDSTRDAAKNTALSANGMEDCPARRELPLPPNTIEGRLRIDKTVRKMTDAGRPLQVP